MAIFEPLKQFYHDFLAQFHNGTWNNYIRIQFDNSLSNEIQPPRFTCPDYTGVQSICDINIEQLLQQSNKHYWDIFYIMRKWCKCEENLLIEYSVDLYFNFVGIPSGSNSISIVTDPELNINLIKIVQVFPNPSDYFYINSFLTGTYVDNNFIPYFIHITPLICFSQNTDIKLKLEYKFSLPPICE